ncbi:MAG: FHA domain-containing protein [Betaproteobacteria bacterium]
MSELVVWAGRMLVLGGLLWYVWAVAGRLALGVAREVRGEGPGSPSQEAPARLLLVQDNSVDGVFLGHGGPRLELGQTVPLGEELTLGRNEDNSLILGDRFTSGCHARLFRRDGSYWVEDVGSKNGTLVNNHRIYRAVRLSSGDRITVGSCTFRFMG